jgi:hypothetical protein
VRRENVFLFNPHAADPHAEAKKMASTLRTHRPDLAILGIGRNGHVAFNEPGSVLNSKCRVVGLSRVTRLDNARFFGSLEEVPTSAMTLGLFDILYARRVLMLATGAEKSRAVRASLDGPVSVDCPASALRRHDDAEFLCDAWAASRTRADRVGPRVGGVEISNFFALPRGKRVVFLSSRLSDVAVSAGAFSRSLSRHNAVCGVVREEVPAAKRKEAQAQAKSQARMLGLRVLFVRSKAGSLKSSASDAVRWEKLLSRLAPDIVLVPNGFHTGASDRWVRRAGLSYAKKHRACAVWSFETDRGLFEQGASDLVFEFGSDLLLSKMLCVRRLRFLLSLRLDLAAKALSVFRCLALADDFAQRGITWHHNRFCEWFCKESGGS